MTTYIIKDIPILVNGPENWMGAINIDGEFELSKSDNRYLYCFKKSYKNNLVYYDVKVFF